MKPGKNNEENLGLTRMFRKGKNAVNCDSKEVDCVVVAK